MESATPCIFFATNRVWSDNDKFGHEEGKGLVYGYLYPSGDEDVSYTHLNNEEELLKRLAGYPQCFVHVHGYDTTFREAAVELFRFSRLAQTLQNDGAITEGLKGSAFVLFSWPSASRSRTSIPWSEYQTDRRHMRGACSHFVTFIKRLLQVFPKRTHILAHSLGAECVWHSMKDVSADEQRLLGRLMWIAADIRKKKVQEKYIKRIHVPTTNYLCRGDKALHFSKINSGHQRMGAVAIKIHHVDNDQLVTNVKISSTSARSVDRSHRHTYFTLYAVVRDIVLLCSTGAQPQARGLRPRGGKKGFKTPKATSRETLFTVYRMYNGTDHFYTCEKKEKERVKLLQPKYRSEGVEFWTRTTEQSGLIPLHRFRAENEHFYTIDITEGEKRNYAKLGHIGYVKPANAAEGDHWVKLHRYYHPQKGDHAYIVSQEEEGVEFLKQGYVYEKVECLVIV